MANKHQCTIGCTNHDLILVWPKQQQIIVCVIRFHSLASLMHTSNLSCQQY
jgi:hypothetical protein